MTAGVRITDGHVDALRAFLTGDLPDALRRNEELREGGDLPGYVELIASTFIVAARRRFSSKWSRADVIRYVADVRMKELSQEDLDPLIAEILVLHALGAEENSLLDEEKWMQNQILLLDAMVQESHLEPLAIDDLLAEARAFAPRWYG